MNFNNLNLKSELLTQLSKNGFNTPTEIQAKCIPIILEGFDVLGCARTGTGKTAAFVLPLLQNLNANKPGIKALILAPTRELALQISESIALFAPVLHLKHHTFIGGESVNKQTNALSKNLDVIVATPGRLLDFLNQKLINLNNVETFVLDEADQMLDMGFIKDIQKIIKYLPKQKQTLLFSATMPKDIRDFALSIQNNAKEISIRANETTKAVIEQQLFFVEKEDKRTFLYDLLHAEKNTSTIIFVRTKYGADKLVKFLKKNNLEAVAIHGDKGQNSRVNALNNFKSGAIKYLIATDIAARGIDINDLPLVINFDMPAVAETYVHRIGRTGRAGKAGKAISFCTNDEKKIVVGIEKLIGKTIKKQQFQSIT